MYVNGSQVIKSIVHGPYIKSWKGWAVAILVSDCVYPRTSNLPPPTYLGFLVPQNRDVRFENEHYKKF